MPSPLTAFAYGSNKNAGGGIRVDTTNTYPELETFFEDDNVPDTRLSGLAKAYRSSAETGHTVGNKDGDADNVISKEGSFLINPNWKWWNKWTEKKNESVDKLKNKFVSKELICFFKMIQKEVVKFCFHKDYSLKQK